MLSAYDLHVLVVYTCSWSASAHGLYMLMVYTCSWSINADGLYMLMVLHAHGLHTVRIRIFHYNVLCIFITVCIDTNLFLFGRHCTHLYKLIEQSHEHVVSPLRNATISPWPLLGAHMHCSSRPVTRGSSHTDTFSNETFSKKMFIKIFIQTLKFILLLLCITDPDICSTWNSNPQLFMIQCNIK